MLNTFAVVPDPPLPVPSIVHMETEAREVLSCPHCRLVQFRTRNSLCRRCRKPFDPPEPELIETPASRPTGPVAAPDDAPAVIAALGARVCELRKARSMTQRELARRMRVPRTYISKIERSKAVPTLTSLERIAEALSVKLTDLFDDNTSRREREIAAILADEFMAEIARLAAGLDPFHRSLILCAAREAASGRKLSA